MMTCYQQGKRGQPANFFAVPDQGYVEGRVTGIQVMRELLEAMKQHECGGRAVPMMPFMRDVGQALTEQADKCRRPAADELVWLMADALEYFARHIHFDKWLDAKQAEAETEGANYAALVARDKAEFVTRMKAGKAAKKADKAVTP
jgi:hypothetical protein